MTPSKWLNTNYLEWQQLSRAEKIAIRDFPVLWAIFELKATNRWASPPTIIQAVDAIGDLQITRPVSLAFDYFGNRYLFANDADYHRDHLGLRKCDWDQVVKPAFLEQNVDAKEKLKTLLLIANRLRNNFLHGTKVTYNFSGQLDNFRHANNTLMYAIALWDG
jgi:hypothetical protein